MLDTIVGLLIAVGGITALFLVGAASNAAKKPKAKVKKLVKKRATKKRVTK